MTFHNGYFFFFFFDTSPCECSALVLVPIGILMLRSHITCFFFFWVVINDYMYVTLCGSSIDG